MLVLGFDPGGVKTFGWCVAETTPNQKLRLHRSGLANHADEAVAAALQEVVNLSEIAAVGIDSPLFWAASGERRADKAIRSALKGIGAKNVGGTVQNINSLRGACLAQGIMAARSLRKVVPTVSITEAHPKALLWLLKVANDQRPVAEVTMAQLRDLITTDSTQLQDHERDAALGAVAAWAMATKASGWRDLLLSEKDAFAPVTPVGYWMPIGESSD